MDVCAKCEANEWTNVEDRFVVTGEEGSNPVQVKIATCEMCGHMQRFD